MLTCVAWFEQAISCHYAASECGYIDVTGTSQEIISQETLEIVAKKFGDGVKTDLDYKVRYHGYLMCYNFYICRELSVMCIIMIFVCLQDVWKLRARVVAGKEVNM